MTRLSVKHTAQHQWYQNTYKTWMYDIPQLERFHPDTLQVAYSSIYNAWVIFINHHEAGQSHDFEEAKTLAIMLYKLHPEWHVD